MDTEDDGNKDERPVKQLEDGLGDEHGHEVEVVDLGPMPNWEGYLEDIFHSRKKGTSANQEFIVGIVQFISCLYVLVR